ncbi:MAG: carbonic anhydrase [Paracoccaceae bacterium]|nr:carbonic anhydrase [Paracoccaceae bacterium]
MSSLPTLLDRNQLFSEGFTDGDLPILPKLRSVILTCVDARVDPAHVLGLELGDAVVLRNNGGRVTDAVIDEIATLAFMVAMMEGDAKGGFEVILMQHTQCGAERFADPAFQTAVKAKLGVDVSAHAIHDHTQSLQGDVARLRDAARIPGHVTVSAVLYDVQSGRVEEIPSPAPLR